MSLQEIKPGMFIISGLERNPPTERSFIKEVIAEVNRMRQMEDYRRGLLVRISKGLFPNKLDNERGDEKGDNYLKNTK